MPVPTLLAVVAHPDDETFGLGSVLLHAAASGARTVVACATRGEAGELAEGVTLPPGGLAQLREAELREAALALGVQSVEVWGLEDSGMAGEPPPGSLAAAEPQDLAALVADAVRRHRPDVVLALDGGDGHRDHLAVRAAVETALAGAGLPVYLWAVPRGLAREWVRAKAEDPAAAAYTENLDIGTPEEQVTTVLDTAAHYDARCRAVALHRSQHSPWDGLPQELQRALLATDHLTRVQPAREPGGRETALLGLGVSPPPTGLDDGAPPGPAPAPHR